VIHVGTGSIGRNEIQYVTNVLERGALANSLYIPRFESEFSTLHQRKHGVFVNSGTDALRIAVATLKEVHGWKDGDQILCPALTFIASSNVILQNGLGVKFVDVNPRTYNLDPWEIGKHISKRTRAIMVVHLFGLPADMSKIVPIAREHGLKIIEDSCETMFVHHAGKPVGSFSDIACFSTYMAHLITTGVGGIAITDSRKYADVMRSFMNHGRDPYFLGGMAGSQSIGDAKVLKRRFQYHRIGYSSRCTEMEAALGIAQLEKYPQIIFSRVANADLLKTYMRLAKLDDHIQLPVDTLGLENSYMMFPLVCYKPRTMWKLCAYLEKNGIETRPMMPLLSQPIYRKRFGDLRRKYPVATWLEENGFYVGCHQDMTDEDLKKITETLKAFFAG
jgi:perosamine synthetase